METNPIDLPHYGVTTRLMPSKIHGVGVFAIKNIPKGITIFDGEIDAIVWMSKKDIPTDPVIKKLYEDFCVFGYWCAGVWNGADCGCPVRFDRMTSAWYINHSEHPNVGCDIGSNYSFYSLRDIEAGEELTVDYSTYSGEPDA